MDIRGDWSRGSSSGKVGAAHVRNVLGGICRARYGPIGNLPLVWIWGVFGDKCIHEPMSLPKRRRYQCSFSPHEPSSRRPPSPFLPLCILTISPLSPFPFEYASVLNNASNRSIAKNVISHGVSPRIHKPNFYTTLSHSIADSASMSRTSDLNADEIAEIWFPHVRQIV